MEKKISLDVTGMHCNSCAKIINEGLLEIGGVEKAEADYVDEKLNVSFDSEKASMDKIENKLNELGYGIKGSNKVVSKKNTMLEGLFYGLVPHIGCIGFIVASVLGVTVAIELFRPLLMNPWFFHILILLSIGFATLSSAYYLRKNGLLSWKGVQRKKKYLAAMYGSTVGINLVLFLLIFPMLANIDTGSFQNTPTGAVALNGQDNLATGNSIISLQVDIPCPGHAPLISGELKTIDGVTGVLYNFPNNFDVAFDPEKTSKEEILALEVFEPYPATVTAEPAAAGTGSSEEVVSFDQINEIEEVAPQGPSGTSSCGNSCGGSCGTPSCGCSG
ncbi:MAG: heavy-metal-associated domain-containing protein [Candidatus Diapherotrites archaeon]